MDEVAEAVFTRLGHWLRLLVSATPTQWLI